MNVRTIGEKAIPIKQTADRIEKFFQDVWWTRDPSYGILACSNYSVQENILREIRSMDMKRFHTKVMVSGNYQKVNADSITERSSIDDDHDPYQLNLGGIVSFEVIRMRAKGIPTSEEKMLNNPLLPTLFSFQETPHIQKKKQMGKNHYVTIRQMFDNPNDELAFYQTFDDIIPELTYAQNMERTPLLFMVSGEALKQMRKCQTPFLYQTDRRFIL